MARLAFGPDPAAVALDDALRRGQAHAGASKFRAGMQPLEDQKEFVGIFFVIAGAVVLDVKNGFPAFAPPPPLR